MSALGLVPHKQSPKMHHLCQLLTRGLSAAQEAIVMFRRIRFRACPLFVSRLFVSLFSPDYSKLLLSSIRNPLPLVFAPFTN